MIVRKAPEEGISSQEWVGLLLNLEFGYRPKKDRAERSKSHRIPAYRWPQVSPVPADSHSQLEFRFWSL